MAGTWPCHFIDVRVQPTHTGLTYTALAIGNKESQVVRIFCNRLVHSCFMSMIVLCQS
jgi:hypothetical protein